MGKKVVGKYKEEHIDKKNVAAFIKPVEVVTRSYGVYNILIVTPLWGGCYHAVIFGDQQALLKKVTKGIDNLYSLHHLLPSSAMHSYSVDLSDGHRITALTVAEATVLARKPVVQE